MVKEDGFSYREVAAHLGVSVLTVRNQVFIATKKITAIIPAWAIGQVTAVPGKGQ